MKIGSDVLKKFNYNFNIEKTLTNDRLIIYGVASTSDVDRDGERMSMASLEKAFGKYMRKNPVIFYNHKSGSDAVGKVIPTYTGEDGTIYKSGFKDNKLFVVGEMSQADSAGDVRTQVEEGILKTFSVAGRARSVKKSDYTCLHVSDLREISITPLPSNEEAMFSVIKNACVGEQCQKNTELNINQEESKTMEQEIIELIEKKFSEQKGIEAANAASVAYEDLKKKYEALVAEKVEVEPEGDVEKSLTEQVAELTATIEAMKSTGIQKGVQDGEVIEKGAKEPDTIAGQMIAKYYSGGN